MNTGDRYVVRCVKKPDDLPKGNVLYGFEPGDYVNIVDLNGPTETSSEGDWPPVVGFYSPVKDLTKAFVFTVLNDHHEQVIEAIGEETADYASGYFGDLISEFDCEYPKFFEIVPVKVVPVIL